jgi:hypothetical protein
MKYRHADLEFESVLVSNHLEGYAGLELYRYAHDGRKLVAKLLFWDASGQFFIETIGGELPLELIESLTTEAKETISR